MKEKETRLVDALNEIKAAAWNQSMAPRLPAISSYLKADEWVKGIGAWLAETKEQMLQKLITGCKSRDEDQFVRGQLAMLVEILELPQEVDHMENIKLQNQERKKAIG